MLYVLFIYIRLRPTYIIACYPSETSPMGCVTLGKSLNFPIPVECAEDTTPRLAWWGGKALWSRGFEKQGVILGLLCADLSKSLHLSGLSSSPKRGGILPLGGFHAMKHSP